MKIETHYLDVMSLEEFADLHGLVMEVHERRFPEGHSSRYYAHFKDAETTDGVMLHGVFGNGSSPEEAIANYVPKISTKRLVIRAMHPDRRNIDVPRLKDGY